MELAPIFRKHKTDKDKNGYTLIYDSIFRHARPHVRHVLEIGIGTLIPGVLSSMVGYGLKGYRQGGSLRAWREYFPNAVIYGIDTQPDTMSQKDDRIRTLLCDSTDPNAIRRLFRKGGELHGISFDLIVDDGSHMDVHQYKTLQNLWKHVRKGGYYIIEDIYEKSCMHDRKSIHRACHDKDIDLYYAGPRALSNVCVIYKDL